MDFNEIKTEILARAKAASACTDQYRRAHESVSLAELCEVIKNNFWWCCGNRVIDAELLTHHREQFAEFDIFVNVSVDKGYLFAYGSATVRASDSATVRASDSATVRASDSATVLAYDSATVRAYGSATVRASDSATVEAYGSATVEAYGSATVEAYGSATVRAYGSAYISCHTSIECELNDSAIVRRWDTNTIESVDPDMKFNQLKS